MLNGKKMNYSNDEHFALALESYGGEEYLRENFPNILKMLYNTREWHRECLQNEDEKIGYTDAFNIVELVQLGNNEVDEERGVFCQSDMSLVEEASFVHMSSLISDPKIGKCFGSFAVHDTKVNVLKKSLKVTHDMLNYTKNPEVQTETTFKVVKKVNGRSVCTADVHDKKLVVDLADIKPDIQKINVKQPVSKKESDSYIRLVYNGRQDDDASYNYKDASCIKIGDTDYVTVYYPFLVEVTLSDGFVFDKKIPVDFGKYFRASLASDVVKGGEICFNTAYDNKIKTEVSKDGKTLTFDFSYESGTEKNYWGVEMPLTSYVADGYFDFHLQFTINYMDIGGGEYSSVVIVTSENLPASDNLVKIKQSKILWGCLGKDTRVHTENGYKKISEIEIGEKLFTNKGYLALKNMVTGTEKKAFAVAVSENAVLILTGKHPISTDKGIIYAEDLTVGHKLEMEDGTFKEIYYLEGIDYNDKVYCPELEESALLSAEGIMVGDFHTFPNVEKAPEKELEPLEPELLEELIRWSELQNEKLEKAVTV